MSRKIISVFIILLMISSLSFSVFAETLNEKKEDVKSKIEEQNQKLEYVQGEISDAVKEIEEIDDKIKDCESQIEDLKTKLAESKKNMDEVTEKYNKVKAEYDKNEKLFQERMVALYEAGDTTYLDLLLTSGSITDFISNYYLVSQLAECDTEVLSEMENTKKEIEDDKKDLESKKAEIDKTKSEIAKKNEQLKSEKSTKQTKVDSLTTEEKNIQSQIDAYDAEMEKIAAAERKAAAEEAARRKKAEEDAKKNASSNNSNNTVNGGTSGSTNGTSTSTGKMTWPIPGYRTLTSSFGYRIHPIYGTYKLHSGIDVGAPRGAKFVAADNGTVLIASYGYNGGYGNYVVISHGNGITTRYGHGTTILVSAGQKVTKGTPVLTVGSTGASTGPHAHFEVRVNGVAVNPMNYL